MSNVTLTWTVIFLGALWAPIFHTAWKVDYSSGGTNMHNPDDKNKEGKESNDY
jgi:hypothetical protein